MATAYTAVTIIVVRAALRQQAETAAAAADPQAGAGAFIPGTPLRAAGDPDNTAVAYWARWHMIPSQRSNFASNMGGPVNIIDVDKAPNLSRDYWLFDAAGGQWTADAVLDALGFDTFLFEYVPG